MVFQDAAVTVLAIAGAAILVRRLTSAMRPKAEPKCEHCPTGAAVQKPVRRGGPSGPPAARA